MNSSKQYGKQRFFQRKYLFGYLAGLVLICIIALFWDEIARSLKAFSLSTIIFAVSVTVSIITLLLQYLQPSSSNSTDSQFSKYAHTDEMISFRNDLMIQQESIEQLDLTLKTIIDSEKMYDKDQTDRNIDELVNSVSDKVLLDSSKEVLDRIRDKIKQFDQSKEFINSSIVSFDHSVNRLNRELESVTKRGNLNLSLGIVTTVVGIVFLAIFIIDIPYPMVNPENTDINATGILLGFIPRISLVIFIEVFAYFFLRLYKSSILEIKYYQNELTNIESKAISLKNSVLFGEKDIIKNVIEKLANTDRNAFLKKNETTIEIENAKFQDENLSSIIKDLVLGKQKSTNGN